MKKTISISDCINNGNISAETSDEFYVRVGGIIGASLGADSARELYNCYNTGEITLVNAKNNSNSCAGGLAGGFMNSATVEKCASSGKVTILMSAYETCRIGVLIGSYASHKEGSTNMGTFVDCSFVAVGDMKTVGYPAVDYVSGANAVQTITAPHQNASFGFVNYQTPNDTVPQVTETTAAPETTKAPEKETELTPDTEKETEATKAPDTTPAVVEADTTATPAKEKSGCGSSLSAASVVVLGLCTIFGAAIIKRKHS